VDSRNAAAEDEPQPFLGSEPPPLVARGLSLVILSLFVVGAILSVVVTVPETISATFVLVPLHGTDPIRAARGGRVTKANVVEGARVAKSRVLYVLRSPGAADRISELQTAEAREAGAREGLANTRRKNESETRAAAGELDRLVSRVAFLERMLVLKKEQLALNDEQSERARRLGEQGLASLDVQADARIRRAQAAMEFEQLQTDLREARTAVEKLRHTEETRRAAFLEEERALVEKVGEARIRIEALRGEIPSDAAGELVVEAPCDGTVIRLEARGIGTVVQEGASLAEIACAGERLQAELSLPQEALAQVRPGLRANLLYDAFPYQRYGVRHGTVRWASPAGGDAGGKDGPKFRAFVDLFDESIRVGGEERPLMPGMKGNALIVVGRRSLVSYAFGPLQQLRESFR
jgi:multidrug efflux pump subunit AcrA (membrane-fusion protein)